MMKRTIQRGLTLAALLVWTSVVPQAQTPQVMVVSGSGSGAHEDPRVAGGAVAFAECTLDRPAQTISCSSRVYNIVDLRAAHLHVGGPGVAGPVVLPIPNLPLGISGAWGQSWTWTARDLTVRPAQGINSLDDVLHSCAAGNCYLNWHTALNPAGEIRINLCPDSRAANTINAIAVCTAGSARAGGSAGDGGDGKGYGTASIVVPLRPS